MTTVADLEKAILALSESEHAELRNWLIYEDIVKVGQRIRRRRESRQAGLSCDRSPKGQGER